jgi:hypothetical protein
LWTADISKAGFPPLEWHHAIAIFSRQTNDPQRAKWSDLPGNGDQPFNDPNGGIDHGRDENAPEKNDSQKVAQVDVSENICEESRPIVRMTKEESQTKSHFSTSERS